MTSIQSIDITQESRKIKTPTRVRPLIHIGYPKAASTWLQQVIFKDPNSGFYAPWGLPSYGAIDNLVESNPFSFSPEKVRQSFEVGLEEAARQNLVPVLSEELFTGNQMLAKYWGKKVADRLHAIFPEARILIFIREQKAAIFSSYRQYIRSGHAATMERFLGLDASRQPGIGPICRLDYFQYDLLINYYQMLFGAENVLVLPFELLKISSRDVSQKVLEFAGSHGNPDHQKVARNVGLKGGTLAFRQQLNNFCTPPEQMNSFHGFVWRFGYKLSTLVEEFLPQKYHDRAEAHFKQTIAEAVGDSFIQSNQRTSQLIGIDLENFGYDS